MDMHYKLSYYNIAQTSYCNFSKSTLAVFECNKRYLSVIAFINVMLH